MKASVVQALTLPLRPIPTQPLTSDPYPQPPPQLLLLLRLLNSWQDESDGSGDDDSQAGTSPKGHPHGGVQDDSALFFMQVLLNTLGIYVGLIGARSANSLQPQAARVSRVRVRRDGD